LADLKLLQAGASELGIDLDRKQLSAFSVYMNELLKWNQRANLTAITTPDGIQTRHFLDSLTCLLGFPGVHPAGGDVRTSLVDLAGRLDGGNRISCLDVGTGAGFPGIPLKIFLPRMQLTLLESIAKKTAFLTSIVDLLELEGVTVITSRAEDLARHPYHRERYDVVTTRALSKLNVIAELTLPFCRIGGRSVALKKGAHMPQEIEEGRYAVRQMGGGDTEEIPVELSLLDEGRLLVVMQKLSSTPDRYPRRPGIPLKRPLLAPSSGHPLTD
jgi:16S rRNA (guanine527-N7)-methyltransferase